MVARILGFFAILACVNPAFAQIKGTVIDSNNAEPVFGVHVTSGNDSTTTNKKGVFILYRDVSEITFSHLGYHTKTLTGKEIYDRLVISLKPSVLQLDQINVRGNFNQCPIMQIPSNIGYIQNIDQTLSDGISYMESLNIVPGVFTHTGSLNTNRIIIRGIGSRTPYGTNRIKAYYNDIPLTTGDGTTEIEDLNTIDIGSIEVLKGSKSALYGSGLGGVIRINEPDYIIGTHGFIKTSVSSYQTAKTDVGIQFRKKGFYCRTNLSNSQTEGWRQNSEYKRFNFMLNTGYKNNKNNLDILILAINAKANIPSSLNWQMYTESPESAAPNWNSVKGYEEYTKIISGILYDHSFSDKWSNKLSLFAHYYSGHESRPFNILDDNSATLGFRNITSLKWKDIKIQTGIESLFETYSWDIYEIIDGEQGNIINRYSENRQPISIFLNGQFKIRNLIFVEAGISLNTLRYKLKDNFEDSLDLSGTYSYDMVYSPFIGLNIPLNKTFRIYSSISNGFSAPSVEETLLPEGSLNPNLKPESGLNTEIGIRFQDKKKQIFADMCIYSMWVSNLLVTKRESEEVFYGANAGKTWHRGIEFSSTIRINDHNCMFPVTVNANTSLTYATFTKYIDDGMDYTGNALPGIPGQNLFIMANIRTTWGFYLIPSYQFIGEQYMDDSNLNIADSYHLAHVKAGYSKPMNLFDVDIALGVRNIMNKGYASMILVNAPSFAGSSPRYYYPGMPRNYFLTLNLSF